MEIASKLIFPITSCNNKVKQVKGEIKKSPPPIFISTNPSLINITTLSSLYNSCNHSPHRFPAATTAAIDAGKLAVAVAHSSVVVSVFAAVSGRLDEVEEREKGLFERIMPPVMGGVTAENGELVGFGRAVSDQALTASIYDVMVIPSLQRLGIGRKIVDRIIRVLISKGIYDISALCSEEERLFFAACGFGGDILGSTTMMYANTNSNYSDDDQITVQAGRKVLVAPPSRLPFSSRKQPPHISC